MPTPDYINKKFFKRRTIMKKRKTLKLASGLLVLCLMTTCVIGTTLAKYTTGGNAADEARVAKWGVTVSMEADPLFKSEYEKTDAEYSGSIAVKSSSTDLVVAPGTNSTQANGSAVFKITGTPEVAARVDIAMSDVKDIVLKAGTYTDPTKADGTTDQFTLADDYYPVVFTLKQVGYTTPIATGTLADIKVALDAYTGATYAPNTVLDATFELSWEWRFDGNDAADTYLGNLMAGKDPDSLATDKYCTTVNYELFVTVTQVD